VSVAIDESFLRSVTSPSKGFPFGKPLSEEGSNLEEFRTAQRNPDFDAYMPGFRSEPRSRSESVTCRKYTGKERDRFQMKYPEALY
jgi:hypothetical protein